MRRNLGRASGNNSRQPKIKSHRTQLQTIFKYLQKHVATASMVSAATGVPQKNLCRYKRDLEHLGRLWEIRKDYCQSTGFKAWYLTTNPERAPKKTHSQTRLEI